MLIQNIQKILALSILVCSVIMTISFIMAGFTADADTEAFTRLQLFFIGAFIGILIALAWYATVRVLRDNF